MLQNLKHKITLEIERCKYVSLGATAPSGAEPPHLRGF
jgi:hypothetical protein